MAFDPTQFGGVKVAQPVKTGAFDPTKFGGVKVAPRVTLPAKGGSTPPTSFMGAMGSAAKGVGDFFTQSEQGLGKDIGAIGAQFLPSTKIAQESSQTAASTNVAFLKAMNAKKQAGQPLTPEQQTLESRLASGNTPPTYNPAVPSTGKTALDIAGTAADVLTAGTYGAAKTAVMDTGKLAVKAAPTAAKVAGTFGRALSQAGKSIYEQAIPTSAEEASRLQAYKASNGILKRIGDAITGVSKAPLTAASTAFSKGFKGTESMIGVQARRATTSLWKNVISPALEKAGNMDMPSFFKNLETKIISENPELSRQKTLLNALQALKEDYSNVGQIAMKTLQDFKKGWAKFVPEKAYRGQPIAGAFNDVRNMAADMARTVIHDAVGPEAKQAYFDYGNLTSLQEWGQKAMTGGKFKGGAGSFISAMKDAVVTPAATIGGRVIYRVGQGMEFSGLPGALTLADLFKNLVEPSAQPQ